MDADGQQRMRVVERAVSAVLIPRGFRRRNLHWRRRTGEVLQQLSVVGMRLGGRYQPCWGLNVLAFDEGPAPPPHRLQARWFFAEALRTEAERRAMYDAFDLSRPVADARRESLVTEFLSDHVAPCFDAFETQESVRAMMATYGRPLRATQFFNLPDDWWPAE